MSAPPRLVFDTSVLIGEEHERLRVPVPDDAEVAITVITLAELHFGVLAAERPAEKERRLLTLVRAQDYGVLVADQEAAERYAGIVNGARVEGRRVKVHDAWIAAIAAANDAAVVTQDDDFDGMPIEVIKV